MIAKYVHVKNPKLELCGESMFRIRTFLHTIETFAIRKFDKIISGKNVKDYIHTSEWAFI